MVDEEFGGKRGGSRLSSAGLWNAIIPISEELKEWGGGGNLKNQVQRKYDDAPDKKFSLHWGYRKD